MQIKHKSTSRHVRHRGLQVIKHQLKWICGLLFHSTICTTIITSQSGTGKTYTLSLHNP